MQPQHQATLRQPLQFVLQHPVANLHGSTHIATEHDNNHAAIESFQCDLQPQIQETHRTTHTGTTTRCKTQRRNQNEHRPHPPRTEGTFQRRLTLHGKTMRNTRFRAPASSPKQNPCNIHAAITMRFAASRLPSQTCTDLRT